MPLFYWGKTIQAEQPGQRVVHVACTKCGSEYYYVLARIGFGNGTAPYGLGVASATRTAQENANRDLRRRLETEADLVPCPSCHWINDELVQGYRRGRYRGIGKFAVIVGIIGTIVSLIMAWLVFIGPAVDHAILPFVLVGGPVFSVSLAGALIALRKVLRNLIQPNRNFPSMPKVPPGSPAALRKDKTSGELKPVAKTN